MKYSYKLDSGSPKDDLRSVIRRVDISLFAESDIDTGMLIEISERLAHDSAQLIIDMTRHGAAK